MASRFGGFTHFEGGVVVDDVDIDFAGVDVVVGRLAAELGEAFGVLDTEAVGFDPEVVHADFPGDFGGECVEESPDRGGSAEDKEQRDPGTTDHIGPIGRVLGWVKPYTPVGE